VVYVIMIENIFSETSTCNTFSQEVLVRKSARAYYTLTFSSSVSGKFSVFSAVTFLSDRVLHKTLRDAIDNILSSRNLVAFSVSKFLKYNVILLDCPLDGRRRQNAAVLVLHHCVYMNVETKFAMNGFRRKQFFSVIFN